MKKMIAIFTVVFALGFAYQASAGTLISGNSCDDCGIFTNVLNKMKLEIKVDNQVFSDTKVNTSANTGGSFIVAKDDITNASIESDDATNDTTVEEEIGSVVIQYEGAGNSDGQDVTVTNNSSDDAIIAATEDNDNHEKVEAKSDTASFTDVSATTDAGNQFMAADEDVDTASVKTGKATTSFVGKFLKGSVLIQRFNQIVP